MERIIFIKIMVAVMVWVKYLTFVKYCKLKKKIYKAVAHFKIYNTNL